jgi:ABC-type microcin C transport system permease subunit YejB
MNAGSASLGRYLIRRLLQAVPLVLGILVITFALIHLAPGDPLIFLAGEGGNAAFYADMRARYGLDQPLIVQFGRYLATTLHGDFGYSFVYQQPVFRVILGRLPATLLLMGTALVLSTTIGLLMGIVTAIRPHSVLDNGIAAFTLTAYAMPVFWLGQLLVLLFAVRLNLLPVQGMVTVRENYTGIHHVLDVIRHLTLPALTLALPQLALTARLTRTSVREALRTLSPCLAKRPPADRDGDGRPHQRRARRRRPDGDDLRVAGPRTAPPGCGAEAGLPAPHGDLPARLRHGDRRQSHHRSRLHAARSAREVHLRWRER